MNKSRVGAAALATFGIMLVQVSHMAAGPAQGSPGSQGSITITGCLKSSDANLSGAAPATGSTSSTTAATNPGYMLTNASIASNPKTWDRGQAGGAGATLPTGSAGSEVGAAGGDHVGTASAPAAYILRGREAELRQHVNQQVEITGQLDSATGATSGRASTAGSKGTSGESRSGQSPTPPNDRSAHTTQRFQVESLRVLSEACSVS